MATKDTKDTKKTTSKTVTDEDVKKSKEEYEEARKKYLEALEEKDADYRNHAIRQKYEKEMQYFEDSSNKLLEEVRQFGASINTKGDTKMRPESITNVHIYFSRQLPDYVIEGVDTSEALEKELAGDLEERIKEAGAKAKEEKEKQESNENNNNGDSSSNNNNSG